MLDFGSSVLQHKHIVSADIQDTSYNQDLSWLDIRSNDFASESNNTYIISTPGQLAYMNYFLTNSSQQGTFSNVTFVLENDIQLDHAYIEQFNEYIDPYWTPVVTGKNYNITFKGNGHTISGLHIKYDDSTPRSVGFFADLIGGVFENVVIDSPVITYKYHGESYASDDGQRPSSPVEVCIGVVAGTADSTYINNVKIVNPTINFVTENSNGHNFYVGSVVGKLSFTSTLGDDGKTVVSSNTVTPMSWGVDSVSVTKSNSSSSTGVNVTINAGSDSNATYGIATNAYVGGLVGATISSKVINSSLNNIPVHTSLAENLTGTFYIGGLTGLLTQITSRRELLVAAGLYNNLLLNVELGDVSSISDYFGGSLVGYVYSGGWIYNNIVIGSMSYDNFWSQVCNSKIRLINNSSCIANINGSINDYYLSGHNDEYPNCAYAYTTIDNGETYVYCSTHGTSEISLSETGAENEMKKYNFKFDSLEDEKYNQFLNDVVEISSGDDIEEYKKIDLMNDFNHEDGFMYHAALPILDYEMGLTVKEINPDTNQPADMGEKVLDAVYQFRTWSYDQNGPYLSGYFGLDYSVTFVSNSPSNSDAYWVRNGNKMYELVVGRTYQQFIYDPEESEKEPNLVCEGYDLQGWKIEGLTDEEILSYQRKGYLDEYGHYIFNKERITESNRRFIADWGYPKDYIVHFVVREKGKADVDYGSEKVKYGLHVSGPTVNPSSNQGLSFVGWFLENNLPIDEDADADAEKCWVFGSQSTDLMPGHDITLYTGWINNFTMLSSLLDDSKYRSYYKNCKNYFDNVTGQNYESAYSQALDARTNLDSSNTGNLLIQLQNAYNALKIDPDKLLDSPAFDETLTENACQFLYSSNARLTFNNYKIEVQKYVESVKEDEEKLYEIESYILYYNKLQELFDGMKDNLHDSVVDVGGIDTVEVADLIDKYQDLQNRYMNLNRDVYEIDSLDVLDSAEDKVEKLWSGEGESLEGPYLSDVKGSIIALENALNSLQVKSTQVDDGGDDDINSDVNEKVVNTLSLGISPVLLGILIVSLMGFGTGGYIGVDVVVNKRRRSGSNKKQSSSVSSISNTKAEKNNTKIKNVEKNQFTDTVSESDNDDIYI